MRKALVVFLLIFSCVTGYGQLQYDWHHATTDTNSNWMRSLQFGDQDELYVIGQAYTNVDLDYSAATTLSPGTSYVAVYSSNGTYLRSWAIAGAGIQGLWIADNGDVLLYGPYIGNVDFDPGAGTFFMNGGWQSHFVARYTKYGQFIWSKSFSNGSMSPIYLMSVEESNDMITVGIRASFYNTPDAIDLDPGPGSIIQTGQDVEASAIVRLDGSGNYVWSMYIPYMLIFYCGMNHGGEIALTGVAAGTIDFDAGPGTVSYVAAQQQLWSGDFFVARYDSWGNYLWHYGAGLSSANGAGYRTHLTPGGEVFVRGTVQSGVDLEPGAGVTTLPSAWNPFIAKYDPSGTFEWAVNNCNSFAVAVNDSMGNLYANDGTGFNCYSPSGNILWALPALVDVPCSWIALSPNHKIALGGQHFTTTDFDPGPGVVNVPAGVQYSKLSLLDPLASVKEHPQSTLSIYPNPASHFITIAGNGSDAKQYNIINSVGETVKTTVINSSSGQVDVADLPNGIYFLRDEEGLTVRFAVSH